MVKEFKLPDVGEGLIEADIVAWHVKPGDQVEDGQIIAEIETAKAVVELPCPWDGTVARPRLRVSGTGPLPRDICRPPPPTIASLSSASR